MTQRSRPKAAPSADADQSTPFVTSGGFGWARCPRHEWMYVSVIVVPDAPDWCVGDGHELHGHWLAEVAA